MTELSIDELESAHAVCVAALRGSLDRDWSTTAGSLVWPATLTAAHLTDVLFSYAFQAAAHGTAGELPFKELEAAPGAEPAGLVDGVHAGGVMLASVLRAMPSGATSRWWDRDVGAEEWAGMGARETLLHTYDIVSGLDGALDPAPAIVAKLLDAEAGSTDPWAQLVCESGRPFGDDEWREWRRARDERRGHPAPAGSVAGVVSDFADGADRTAFGEGWKATTDERLGGASQSVTAVVDGGPNGLPHAMRVSGEIIESAAPMKLAGATARLSASREEPANLSGWTGVRFWVRGPERSMAVWSMTSTAGGFAGRHEVPLHEDWAPHRLPFHWFGTDGSDLTALLFAVDSKPGPFWFELGDVRLY